MRLTLLLLVISVLSAFPSSYAQKTKLDINVQNSRVKEVLDAIETQSEFFFMYNNKQVDVDRKVDLDSRSSTIDVVLQKLFAGTEVNFKVVNRQILLFPNDMINLTEQQDKKVTGNVTDSSGAPLPGASVVVKGTTTGIITDNNGNYSLLNIPENAVLQFSFIGMKSQEIAIGVKTTLNVKLVEETIGIEEVVAIGYGSQKRSNLTSSISKITDQALTNRPISNVSEAFAGQLAGVRAQNASGVPGSQLTIRIRGVNTINGSSEPLYVVDGVPRDNMGDINPSDISSIQILKDASATSIYGARGGNGVVLVETKKGTGKPSFNFTSYYGVQKIEKKMDMMNKNEWLAYQAWSRNLSWLQQGHSMKDPMASRPANLQIPDAWLDPTLKSTDWQDAIFQTAPIQSYQLSGSTASDIGSIFISGGYMDQKGVVYNTYFKRTNFRFNGILNVNKKLKLGMNIAPTYSTGDARGSEGKENVIHHAIAQVPLVQLNQGTRDLGFPTGFSIVYPNPLEQLKNTTDNTQITSLTNSVWGEWQIINGLTFKSQLGYDFTNRKYEYFMPGNVTYNNGNVTVGNSNSKNFNDQTFQNTLVYDKKFGNHSVNILAGQSIDDHKSYLISAMATGWPNEVIQTLNVAKTPTTAQTYKDEYKGESLFGRLSYNYKDKYLLNASMRRDGSSRFGNNNKYGVFPSVSAGWKLNEESFLENVKWLSLLKLRAAWGKAGNDRVGNYDYMALLALENTSWGNGIVTGIAPSNIANDNLKWETTETTDIGFDLTCFKNRVQVNLDYYRNKTNDLLFNAPIPNTTGFSGFRTNLGSIQNQGWEIDMTTVNTTGAFKWTTTLNISKEKNKVLDMGGPTSIVTANWDAQFITKIGGPVSQFYAYQSNGVLSENDFDANKKPLVPIMAGQKAGNIKYVDQKTLDTNSDGVPDAGDGVINASDFIAMGTNLPDFLFGITNNLSWKNFELSVLLQGQEGGKVLFLGQRQFDNGNTGTNVTRRWLRQWKPDYEAIYGPGENPIPQNTGVDTSWDGKTPSVIGNRGNNNDDTRIYNATFLRIKNVTLSYKLPRSIINKTFIKNARLYVSSDNLRTFTKYPGFNVETNNAGNSTTQLGVDYATYPLSRRYTLGINLTF